MADEGVDPVTGRVLEDEAKRAAGLAALKLKIEDAKAKGKKFPREDDQFLLAFLRSRKYNIEKAFLVVSNFAEFWYGNAPILEGLCAEKVRACYATGMMRFLPGRDKSGNIVTALTMSRMDNSVMSPKAINQLSVYTLAYMFEHDDLQLHGCTYVETMEGFSFFNAMFMGKKLEDKEQQKLMSAGLDTFPMRIREIYLIHQPSWFSVFWAIVKLFIKAKLAKRLHLLGQNTAALHEVVDPANLPPEFGGTLDEPLTKFLDDMEAQEKATGMIGGFAFPLSVEDPTGAKRRAAPATVAGGAGAFAADAFPAAAGAAADAW